MDGKTLILIASIVVLAIGLYFQHKQNGKHARN